MNITSQRVRIDGERGPEPLEPARNDVEPSPILMSPELVSGDPLTVIAKLVVMGARQQRASATAAAATQEGAEDAADAKRIEEMANKARHAFVAGVAGGLARVASGLTSIDGAAKSAQALGGPDKDLARANAQNILSGAEGKSAFWDGCGKTTEAFFTYAANGADRAAAEAEVAAKAAKRARETLEKQVDGLTQHEGKVVQLMQEIRQAQAQAERAALLRMA